MREEIEARPAVILIAGLILGLTSLLHPVGFLAFAALCVWIRPVFARCLLAGALVVGLALTPRPAPSLTRDRPVHGVGSVLSVPAIYPYGLQCEIEVDDQRLLLVLPRSSEVVLGDRLRVDGVAKPLTEPAGRFTEVQGRLSVRRAEIVAHGPWVARLADGWRRSFMSVAGDSLGARDASLVDALCFNARGMLEQGTRDEMAQSGTVHIVSASGLQVFVFGFLLSMALRFFPVPRWAQILLLAVVLVFYSLAAGLQPQIVRAAFMTLLGLSAYLVKRDPDALSALCLSGALYLLWRPEAVYGMAFQLSFVTVAALILFYHPARRQRGDRKAEVIRVTNEFLKFSGIIALATTPLIAYYMGYVSLVVVAANLLMCWCLPVIVGIAFAAHLVSLCSAALGGTIASLFLAPLCHWIYAVVNAAGGGTATLQVAPFSAYWLFAFYGAWLMTHHRRVIQP